MNKVDYERKYYAKLAKEFGCTFRMGKYGVKFFNRDPSGKVHKLIAIIPLTGWVTNPKEVERIMRERGLEL